MMPVVTAGNARFCCGDENLPEAFTLDKLCQPASVVLVFLQLVGEVVCVKIGQICAVKALFHKSVKIRHNKGIPVSAKALNGFCKSAESDFVEGVNFKETFLIVGCIFHNVHKLCHNIINVAECQFPVRVIYLQRQAVCNIVAEGCHNCVVVRS